MKKKLGAWILAVVTLFTFAGCTMVSDEPVKQKDLGFTVVSEEKIPEELMTIIEEKKAEPFQLTYSDDAYLYIVIGYGQKDQGGYSIAVDELYLTEDAIHTGTTLLGPGQEEKGSGSPSWPYIVLKLDYLDKPVLFE